MHNNGNLVTNTHTERHVDGNECHFNSVVHCARTTINYGRRCTVQYQSSSTQEIHYTPFHTVFFFGEVRLEVDFGFILNEFVYE